MKVWREEVWETEVAGNVRLESIKVRCPSGATPNRQTMTRLAESAGRWLEPVSNDRPRGMVVHDRTRLID
jgi:hypothetical protein